MLAGLRRVDLLAGLSDEESARWVAVAEPRSFAAGTVVVEADADAVGLVLLLEGTIEGLVRQQDRYEPEIDHVAPTWLGAIPTLLRAPSPIRMVARDRVSIAIVPPDAFRELVFASPAIFDRIMAQVRPVLGRFGEAERTRERLISLGTMAAGLAHELNNPASAARRASAELADALARLQPLVGRLVPGDVDADDLQHVARDHRAVSAYSTLEIADAEDALTLVLEELGVPEPWRLVGSLAAVGISGERARELVASSGPMVLEWLAFLSNSQQASQDLAAATRRVTELVGAMENYAYLDRGAVNDIDVHEGLDATLTVLAPAAESRAVSIRRDYAGDLPRVVGDGAELNQVWTNLIENAVAAASAAGTVTISTRVVDGHVEVDVTDDGPGVDPEIRGRIFDPFFTTRDVGQGIGLGLHTARQIVAEHHHGTLTMSSRPGRTTFRTRLPGASPRLV